MKMVAAFSTRVILYTIEGYAQNEADHKKSTEDYYGDYERYLSALERYIKFFEKCFYRQRKRNEHL